MVYRSHSSLLSGHISSLAEEHLVAGLESSEVGFSVTGTKLGTEHLLQKAWQGSFGGCPFLFLGDMLTEDLLAQVTSCHGSLSAAPRGIRPFFLLWLGLLSVTAC